MATTQYTDIAVVPGQTYYYWVTAVDANALESVFPNPVFTSIPLP